MKNFFLVIALVLLPPSLAAAFTATWVDSNYSTSSFPALLFQSKSIGFDQFGDFYTAQVLSNSLDPNTVNIFRNDSDLLDAYYTFASAATGVTTNFNDTLYISESNESGDTGQIITYDLSSGTVTDGYDLDLFRPTGISYNPATDSIFFTAKMASDTSAGGLYELLSDGSGISTVDESFKGTGLAIDHGGNFYVSVGGNVTDGYEPWSIYRFDTAFENPELIATFDSSPDELCD